MINNAEINKTVTDYVESAEKKYATLHKLRISKGIYSDNDILDAMVNHYRLEGIKLNDAIQDICREQEIEWSVDEWKEIDDVFKRGCKLKEVPFLYYPADLGFDELREGIYPLSDRLDGLSKLFYHTEPVGKTFSLKLKLDNDGNFVWVDYSFSVKRVYAGSDRWEGYKVFYGAAVFPGYFGEVDINIKEDRTSFKSTAYQKVYRRSDDPIWKKRKASAETHYRLDLLDEIKTNCRGE